MKKLAESDFKKMVRDAIPGATTDSVNIFVDAFDKVLAKAVTTDGFESVQATKLLNVAIKTKSARHGTSPKGVKFDTPASKKASLGRSKALGEVLNPGLADKLKAAKAATKAATKPAKVAKA